MSPKTSDITAAIVDLCAEVESEMGKLRQDYQLSIYDVCLSLGNRITREMDRMVHYVGELINQNAFLYDRVVALEERDDPEKVSLRNRNLQNRKKGKKLLRTHSSESMDEVRRSNNRRRVHSFLRQAG